MSADKKADYFSYFELGRQYVDENRYIEAEVALKQSINDRDDFYGSWYMMGGIHLVRKEFLQAEEALLKSLELKPFFVPALINLGIVYTRTNQYRKAVDNYFTALLIDDNNALLYKHLGKCLYLMGDKRKAVFALKKAIKLNPKLSEEIKFEKKKA